ncbi:MAG TPA: transglycosylase SLT domain-containing protein, partial [bacterium]|nr:transglycosylase SLT domain-containing protein [bacterium]
DEQTASLALLAKAALLYYSNNFGECVKLLSGNDFSETLSEYASILKIAALVKNGENDAAIAQSEKFINDFPDSINKIDVVVWGSRAFTAQGKLQTAAQTALDAVTSVQGDSFSKGRAIAYAASLFAANGETATAAKLLVSIAENYPTTDLDSDLNSLITDPIAAALNIGQRVSLSKYFIEKQRGFPVKRFLFQFKDQLTPEGVFLLAKAEYLTGSPYKSGKLLEFLSSRNPDPSTKAKACFLKGQMLFKSGLYSKAAAMLSVCASNYTEVEKDSLTLLAKAFAALENEEARLKIITKLVGKYPDTEGADDLQLQIARKYLNMGLTSKAVEAYAKFEASFPSSPLSAEAFFWLGRLALDSGDTKTAAEWFGKVRDKFPYSYFYYKSCEYLEKIAKPEQAKSTDSEEPADLAILIPKSNPHISNGNLLRKLGLFDMASREFEAAGSASPEDAAIGKSRILHDLGQYVESTKTLEKIASVNPLFYKRLLNDYSLEDIFFSKKFSDIIAANAEKNGIDPEWIFSIIRQESRFQAKARSSSNALGLMQIIPSTGAWIAEKTHRAGYSTADLYDPALNIEFGAWYFNYLTKKFDGDTVRAVAAYNGGPGNVTKWVDRLGYTDTDRFIERIPRGETREYVKKVILNHYIYSTLINRKLDK